MSLVNTLIIGAGRSGTTSLYAYLEKHPAVNFSITKELHYFSIPDLYNRGENYFHSLFTDRNKKIIATADTYLLMDAEAPARVKAYNANMKLIIMLREPVARAYSNFNYSVNFGHEKSDISFLETIKLEPGRLNSEDIVEKNNLCHFYGSLYYKHISYWNKYFPSDQILIFKLADLKNNPEQFYKNVCIQLGINYVPFEKQDKEFNVATGAKSKWLQQLLLNRNNPVRKVLSFMLRPFRKLVIQSGMIDKVYALNKKTITIQPLTDEEKQIAKAYFKEDEELLIKTYGISLNN